MSLAEEVEALRQIPLFANIEMAQLRLLAFTSERRSFRAGEALFVQDEPADAAYVLLCGTAEVLASRAGGEPVAIATLGPRDIVGEIAILCDTPRTATVRATSDLSTLCISKDLFYRLVTEFPQMAVEIMRVLAGRLERTTRELAALREG